MTAGEKITLTGWDAIEAKYQDDSVVLCNYTTPIYHAAEDITAGLAREIAANKWEQLGEFQQEEIVGKFEIDYCYWSFESFGDAFSDFTDHMFNLLWFAAHGADGDSAVEIMLHIQRGTMPAEWFDRSVGKMNADGLMFAGKCQAVIRFERIIGDISQHCILVANYEPGDEYATYFVMHAMRQLAVKYTEQQNRLSGKVATVKF